MNPSDPSEEANSPYLGRWVAELRGKVIAQGGTPEQARMAAKNSRYKEKPEIRFMHGSIIIDLPPIYHAVRALLLDTREVYLVGGAVRDVFVKKPLRDMDFVVRKGAIKLARKVANALNAAFYPLDSERDTGRVLIKQAGQTDLAIDFSSFRGKNLTEDLEARDFTINAMAIDIHDQSIHDPLGGAADLRNKQLRVCNNTSFIDDPLRIIRAVRMALTFDLRINPETKTLIKESTTKISNVSSERIRDEIFRILQGPKSAAGIKTLDMLGVLKPILPELIQLKGVAQSPPHVHDVWDHSMSVIDHLESILAALSEEYHPETASNYFHGTMVMRIGRYRRQIADHFANDTLPGRSWREILLFAGLYHDVAKPLMGVHAEGDRIRYWGHEGVSADIAAERALQLRMSKEEVDRIKVIIQNHMRLHFHTSRLLKEQKTPSRRAIYRFFRDTGEAGVDVSLLTLADLWATYDNSLPEDTWIACLDIIREILEAWWEKHAEKVSPPRLISGQDIMKTLEIDPGPEVGMIIEAVREAQVIGTIHDYSDAMEYACKYLQKSRKGDIKEFANLSDIRLAYYQRPGQGIPLILIHGYPLDHTIWQPMVPFLDRKFWVIMPDLPGFGHSGNPTKLDFMEDYADYLAGLMDSIRIKRAIIGGHSMGGYAALAFAAKYSQRLSGLGLIASRTSADTPIQKESRLKSVEEIERLGMEIVAAQMPKKLTYNPAYHKYLEELILKTDRQGAIHAVKAMMNRLDTSDVVASLEIPILVLAGDKDALIPIEQSRDMVSRISNCNYQELSGVGHMPMLEDPQSSADAINKIFKKNKS